MLPQSGLAPRALYRQELCTVLRRGGALCCSGAPFCCRPAESRIISRARQSPVPVLCCVALAAPMLALVAVRPGSPVRRFAVRGFADSQKKTG